MEINRASQTRESRRCAAGGKKNRLGRAGAGRRRPIIQIALLLLVGLGPLPPHAGAVTEEALGPAIRAAIAVPALEHGVTAVLVQSLRDGRTLYATNPKMALMPASNAKLFTAILALEHLGPEFRFPTVLAARGKVSQGVLAGDLILKGFGDPTLVTATLHDFVNAVRAKGIERVEGDLLVDATYFTAPRWGSGWSWDYLEDYYAMEISALSLNNNTMALVIQPGTEAGRPALISWAPPTRHMEVINETTTGAPDSPRTLRYSRELGKNRVVVRGAIPLGSQPAVLDGIPVEDPALYCGHVLSELLRQAGIPVAGRVRYGTLPEREATRIYQHHSAPLSEILPLFLKPSNNHIGEQLIHTILAVEKARLRQASQSGAQTPPPSIEGLADALITKSGADPRAVRLVDGSGLSRLNLVTALSVVQLLRYAYQQPYRDVLVRALPVAGNDGTLRRRMRETRAAGNVRAKTGTLNAVSGLSGYVTAASGEPLVFSILMNNFLAGSQPAREAQDRICVLLSELER
jgi:D-alanyl-D-alanine carboxypeptidase/D-alanyl-D-alanine-endopeptidase (penicillin-binding protein 4)